jgi:hypothetical protein
MTHFEPGIALSAVTKVGGASLTNSNMKNHAHTLMGGLK